MIRGDCQSASGVKRVHGSDVRRKVLALLCFLLSRTDHVRDKRPGAGWPMARPRTRCRSELPESDRLLPATRVRTDLHRRMYHRAIFTTTPTSYGSTAELVSSRRLSSEAIRAAESDPSPDNVDALERTYHGRFALDFAYEEWSAPYQRLNARGLPRDRRARRVGDTNGGEFDRAIGLARRALDVDPEAEQVELSLLRLYRRTGAHSAAAEQYVHYASVLTNDLGIEPPPLDHL